MNISIFYEKQDMYKVLKELTYNLGNVAVDIKESNSNRQDIDIAKYTYDDAKYIRKRLISCIYFLEKFYIHNVKNMLISLDRNHKKEHNQIIYIIH